MYPNQSTLQLGSTSAQRNLAIILFVTSSILISVSPARACTCDPESTPQRLQRYESVLSGLVIAEHVFYDQRLSYTDLRDLDSDNAEHVFEFKVYAVWKGPVTEEYIYVRAGTPQDCGARFQPGKEYVLYAGPEMDVDQCGMTLLTQEFIDELGEAKPPRAGTREPRPSFMDSNYPWVSEEELIRLLARRLSNVDPRQIPRTPAPKPTITPTQILKPSVVATEEPVPALPAQSPLSCEPTDPSTWVIPAVAGAVLAVQVGILGTIYALRRRTT